MPSSTRRKQAFYGAAAAAVALAALVMCNGERESEPSPRSDVSAPTSTPFALSEAPVAPSRSVVVATPTPVAKKKVVAAATPAPKTKKNKKNKKKKLLADVDPKDFVVSNVSVSETGYKARIDGYVRMTRKGALAQPLMTFDLKDGNGSPIHSGTFTPMDASGPAWIGYDELGLKRVPFTTTVDLRADGGVLPAVPPRPYSASVRVAEVIDAKPAKTR